MKQAELKITVSYNRGKQLSGLDDLRKKIDTVDRKIIDLLNERTQYSKQIGKIKDQENLPYYQPEREKAIIDKLQEYNNGDFPQAVIESIFKEVFSASRALQKKLKVAYFGLPGSFTHAACIKQFGSSADSYSVVNITDIFKEVQNDKADYGIVPVENSYEGVVTHTLDMFVDFPLKICSERFLKISQCLISNLSDLKEIKKVYSHRQALAQCRLWLENHLPHAETIEASSTSEAAKIAQWDKYSASIGSEISAEIYGLNVLADNIQDAKENITRFLVIGKTDCSYTGEDKTSLILTIKDEVGALLKILTPFNERGVSLSKIESRPSRKRAWDYFFFLDARNHISEKPLADAIEEVKKYCLNVQNLGSYPRGTYPY